MTDQTNAVLLAEPTDDRTTARPHALFFLAAGSAIAGTGLGAGGTAGGLLGTRLAGTQAAAGLPLGMLVVGSAVAALLISQQPGRLDRGVSLAAGFGVGAAGASLAVLAAATGSLTTLLAASLLLGAANASLFLTRYAAATVCGPVAAGRAIGLVLFATSIGAVASPLLLGPSDMLAESLRLPALSGLYLVAILAYGIAGAALLIAGSSRAGPERRAQQRRRPAVSRSTWPALSAAMLTAPAAAGLATLALANFVMVSVMAVAPLRLMEHGGGMEMTGTAISAHAAGMFLPSPISGWLSDKVGPEAVAAAGLLILDGAGVAGCVVSDDMGLPVLIVLIGLGVGWNFAVVGASTWISRAGPAPLRTQIEGVGEVAMGVAAGVGAPVAGLLVDAAGMRSLFVLIGSLCAAALAIGALLRLLVVTDMES